MASSHNETTSAGMPSIETSHDALDAGATLARRPAAASGIGEQAQRLRASAGSKALGIADEGKAQVTQTLDGIVEAAREIASKLESSGAAPIARYAHQAADAVAGWSSAIDRKSVEDVLEDTRTLVRTSPAIAVGISLAAGFVLSRFLKATAGTGSSGRGY